MPMLIAEADAETQDRGQKRGKRCAGGQVAANTKSASLIWLRWGCALQNGRLLRQDQPKSPNSCWENRPQ
jgi:hypothetical protein